MVVLVATGTSAKADAWLNCLCLVEMADEVWKKKVF
jgi:hypothetical protein